MQKALERDKYREVAGVQFLTNGAQGAFQKSRWVFNKQLCKLLISLYKETTLKI